MNSEDYILKQRAIKTANKRVAQISEETLETVEFLLQPERYAVQVEFISEVLTLKEITTIPGIPLHILSIINFRGKIISIINLKVLFNLKEKGLTELNKVIIIKNDNMEFGIIADAIIGNKSISLNSIKPSPVLTDNIENEFITGVTTDGLIVLNAEKLLLSKQILFNK